MTTTQAYDAVNRLTEVSSAPAGANAGTYCCAYDANGNVMALASADDGSVAARYEYGPFGELIRATGPMAKTNPFLFSTKYYDWETGLYYCGYRYYDPSTGRWLSRDPIEEKGGLNTYCYLANDAVKCIDLLGLELIQLPRGGTRYQAREIAGHASMEIFGNKYGFGQKDIHASPLWTIGTTEGWDETPEPREEAALYISQRGRFHDDDPKPCKCNATPERIIKCANWYKRNWEGTRYSFPSRTCRTYVDAIIRGCCLFDSRPVMN